MAKVPGLISKEVLSPSTSKIPRNLKTSAHCWAIHPSSNTSPQRSSQGRQMNATDSHQAFLFNSIHCHIPETTREVRWGREIARTGSELSVRGVVCHHSTDKRQAVIINSIYSLHIRGLGLEKGRCHWL